MIYNMSEKNSLKIASKLLLDGEIIIYSTDTLYGFGVDATNTDAIDKINIIKKRKQPYSIIVSSLEMLKKYSIINMELENKFKNFLPGPYTVILERKKSNLSSLVSLNLGTVGIRIPDNQFVLDIVKKINRPIITTSINTHGQPSLNDINEISRKYNKINIFSDNIKRESKGSTIIDFSSKPYKIIRQGDQSITL